MHRQADAQFAAGGVTADQFVLLSILAEGDQITQQELGRRASSDPNTIRAMLVLLEKQELVARRPHPTDGRARSVSLTAKGRKTYQELWKLSQPLRDRLANLFKQPEGAALVEGLKRIAEN
jgi:DNA-binding MarR family transcriptional regulator